MKIIKLLVASLLTVLLVACGTTPQTSVQLKKEVLTPNKRIGILVHEIPKPTTQIVGASCLLCYGVAAAANATLDKHLATLPISDLDSTKNLVLEGYKGKANSVEFVTITESELKKLKKFKNELGYAEKDYRIFKELKNIDILVVLQYRAHGAYRGYSAYVPVTDPLGFVLGVVYSIDLETNQYLQYLELEQKIAVDGEWDEPSQQFPGVTNAYYQAVELTKASINKIFL